MKGVNRKSLKLLSLIPILLISTIVLNIQSTATAQVTPNVFIDPPESSANPPDTFIISVNITNVEDLYSYDVRIQWNRYLLQCLSANEGPFLSSNGPTIFLAQIYADYVIVACSFLGGYSASGSGTLFTANFKALDIGTCALDIYESTLLDPTLTPISHTSEDGYFSTTATANLVKKSAWPEHHHFDISKDEDGYQNLTGKVKNLGPIDLKICVEFDLVRDDGYITVAQTPTVVVLAGTEVNLVAMLGPLTNDDVGKYAVNATCWYSYAGDSWAQGTKTKAFSFAAVP